VITLAALPTPTSKSAAICGRSGSMILTVVIETNPAAPSTISVYDAAGARCSSVATSLIAAVGCGRRRAPIDLVECPAVQSIALTLRRGRANP
jgi:hypothetical protein